MAELITVARPYASGVFAHAREQGQLAKWSEMLGFLVGVYGDSGMRSALANPTLTRADIERLFLAVCGDRIDGTARNLIGLLVRNDRLEALPQVLELFEALKAKEESIVDAEVESAFPMSGEQLAALVRRLEARMKRAVRPSVKVVPELIGGVRVQIGDDVWDASVRGQLDSMATALTK
ncbi:MAG: F0F1 ATP synthase subunit delta [Burkholderiales bacterium]|nr:F0F1 ATP synthase subunit delta [Burkholderiales bacterium]